jgi:hypothetical protein
VTQEKGSWLTICEAMVNEADPKKMLELAEQLFAALDGEKMGGSGRLNFQASDQAAGASSDGSPRSG